jgi:hypothetical protein
MTAESEPLKNQVVEPELCGICSDRFTVILRKKTTCKFCHASTCSKCVEQYLLTRHEDAHCLHCRVNYNDATLHDICTRTYLQQTYFKHRQEVLINRERANLPLLQDQARREKQQRERWAQEGIINKRIAELKLKQNDIQSEHHKLYVLTYGPQRVQGAAHAERLIALQEYMDRMEDLRERIRQEKRLLYDIRYSLTVAAGGAAAGATGDDKKEEEKKKFVRRCTRDGCQGFLSTAWKCGLCEWHSCSKCFAVKGHAHDAPHECKKEDLETAELIKKDCKPCPKCGEFIEKSSGCDQMFCISCQTPFSWITGKIVTSGPIHNPHYYEWMRRTGGAVPRNPADVPCGGFPAGYELVRFPRGMKRNIANIFYEFHRVCMELQDMSTRQYRTHIDQAPLNQLNVKFLLGEMDEKKWGRLLAVHEKKRKRDAEIQEVLGAFRMVAVELINRVQHYRDERVRSFGELPIPAAEKFIVDLNVQIQELITMINDALRTTSITHAYSVPYINIVWNEKEQFNCYRALTKNFKGEGKKPRVKKEANAEANAEDDSKSDNDSDDESVVAESVAEVIPHDPFRHDHIQDENEQLQQAIANSLRSTYHR